MFVWLEIIERTVTNGVKAWLGIKRNAEKIAKLQSEVERLQNQFDKLNTRVQSEFERLQTQSDELNMRSLNHDLRLDNEEKTVTLLVASSEVIEAKINRAMANSEHAIHTANNAARNP